MLLKLKTFANTSHCQYFPIHLSQTCLVRSLYFIIESHFIGDSDPSTAGLKIILGVIRSFGSVSSTFRSASLYAASCFLSTSNLSLTLPKHKSLLTLFHSRIPNCLFSLKLTQLSKPKFSPVLCRSLTLDFFYSSPAPLFDLLSVNDVTSVGSLSLETNMTDSLLDVISDRLPLLSCLCIQCSTWRTHDIVFSHSLSQLRSLVLTRCSSSLDVSMLNKLVVLVCKVSPDVTLKPSLTGLSLLSELKTLELLQFQINHDNGLHPKVVLVNLSLERMSFNSLSALFQNRKNLTNCKVVFPEYKNTEIDFLKQFPFVFELISTFSCKSETDVILFTNNFLPNLQDCTLSDGSKENIFPNVQLLSSHCLINLKLSSHPTYYSTTPVYAADFIPNLCTLTSLDCSGITPHLVNLLLQSAVNLRRFTFSYCSLTDSTSQRPSVLLKYLTFLQIGSVSDLLLWRLDLPRLQTLVVQSTYRLDIDRLKTTYPRLLKLYSKED
ncbi:hypothetical protein RCL1_006312 [Eukaryota sp. TZLM3-RCL]